LNEVNRVVIPIAWMNRAVRPGDEPQRLGATLAVIGLTIEYVGIGPHAHEAATANAVLFLDYVNELERKQ
jgi:hypothetical protein